VTVSRLTRICRLIQGSNHVHTDSTGLCSACRDLVWSYRKNTTSGHVKCKAELDEQRCVFTKP
jgi:hypothetical protein